MEGVKDDGHWGTFIYGEFACFLYFEISDHDLAIFVVAEAEEMYTVKDMWEELVESFGDDEWEPGCFADVDVGFEDDEFDAVDATAVGVVIECVGCTADDLFLDHFICP